VTSLSHGDEDLHDETGEWHLRQPPGDLPPDRVAGWKARALAHENTHRAQTYDPELEYELR
jgi:hypothetical protein